MAQSWLLFFVGAVFVDRRRQPAAVLGKIDLGFLEKNANTTPRREKETIKNKLRFLGILDLQVFKPRVGVWILDFELKNETADPKFPLGV